VRLRAVSHSFAFMLLTGEHGPRQLLWPIPPLSTLEIQPTEPGHAHIRVLVDCKLQHKGKSKHNIVVVVVVVVVVVDSFFF